MPYPGSGNLKNKKNIEIPAKKTLKFGKSADPRRKHVAKAEDKWMPIGMLYPGSGNLKNNNKPGDRLMLKDMLYLDSRNHKKTVK